MSSVLHLLGLAMRARKVVVGEAFVLKELSRSQNAVVFLANDSGDNIRKKVNDKTKIYDFTLITKFSSEELSKAIGKENRRLILVQDKGFCKKFREYLDS